MTFSSSPRRRSIGTVLLLGWLAFATTGCALLNKPKRDREKHDDQFSCGEHVPPSARPIR